MSTTEVRSLLGDPLRTEPAALHQEKWVYREVTQRESIDRVFGIIPIRNRAKPEEMRVLLTFDQGRVALVELVGIPFSCGEFGPPPVLPNR